MELGSVNALRQHLQSEGFDPTNYSLSDAITGYWGYQLVMADNNWEIKYYERGDLDTIETFESEQDAIKFFLARMYRDFPPKESENAGVSS